MAQKVRLVAYRGVRAAGKVQYARVFEDMEAACNAFGAVRAIFAGANVAFEGLDFDAAMAELAGAA